MHALLPPLLTRPAPSGGVGGAAVDRVPAVVGVVVMLSSTPADASVYARYFSSFFTSNRE